MRLPRNGMLHFLLNLIKDVFIDYRERKGEGKGEGREKEEEGEEEKKRKKRQCEREILIS